MDKKQSLDLTQDKQFRLGDIVAQMAKVLHIPHCPKCEKRRQILNEIQNLGMKETIRRLRKVGEGNADVTSKNVKEIMKKLADCCKE